MAAVDEFHAAARGIARLGRRHDDATLVALGTDNQGRLLHRAGAAAEGLTLLDDAMLTADAGPLAPRRAASLGCPLLAAADELVDLQRPAATSTAPSVRTRAPTGADHLPSAGPHDDGTDRQPRSRAGRDPQRSWMQPGGP